MHNYRTRILCIYTKILMLSTAAEDIFYEETAYVLSGERTPEECGDILESRLSAFLSVNG